MGLTLLTGGARSGKSAIAVRAAAAWNGPVTLIVTAEERDEEMRAKIARHRADRPAGWRLVEEPTALGEALRAAPEDHLVLVDCLTLWVSNLVERGSDAPAIEARASDVAKVAAARPAPAIVVTNEVGDGIVPMEPSTRAYRDLMGTVNATFAAVAQRALLVVAGRAIELNPTEEVIQP
jgi:adenosylcobinamide kinase / adenosylcobinamide-phosphate guanylyltransferase